MSQTDTSTRKLFVSSKDESVKLFKNGLVDKLSRVHFTVPLFLFVPVILYYLYVSIFEVEIPALLIFAFFMLGILLWTFIEYILHRFLFHFHPTTEWGKKVSFTFHGVHHDYPNDSKRLVMVPAVSIPLAFLFYYTYLYIFGTAYVNPVFSGFVFGYLCYDMVHYYVHHGKFKSKYWTELKNHHMFHHYKEPDLGFGVSTKMWDYVFGTNFDKAENNETK